MFDRGMRTLSRYSVITPVRNNPNGTMRSEQRSAQSLIYQWRVGFYGQDLFH
jgi:hypothetical protein